MWSVRQVEATNQRAMHEREMVTALGQSTAIRSPRGQQRSGSEVDVCVHTVKSKHEGGFIANLDIYPQTVATRRRYSDSSKA